MVVAGTSGISRGVTVWPQELWQGTHSMAGSEGGLAGSRHPGESALALGWRREKGEAGQQLNLIEVWVPSWGHWQEMRERQKFSGACTGSEGARS